MKFTLGVCLLSLVAKTTLAQSVIVDSSPPSGSKTAPPAFIGFACEWFAINRFTLAKPYANPVPETSVLSPVSVNAVLNLRAISKSSSKTIIRIGGNSARDMFWVPSLAGPFSTQRHLTDEVDVVQLQYLELFANLTNSAYMINIGTRFPNPREWYTEEFLAALKEHVSPGNIHSIEIGNEPDHFVKKDVRSPDWGYDDFLAEFRAYQEVVSEYFPLVPQAGPSYAFPWRDQGLNERFIRDVGSSVRYNTIHRYDLMGCNPSSTIDELMTRPEADLSTYDFFVRARDEAAQYGMQVVWNEAGTASCGGLPGISDAFGSALWATDAAMSAAYLQLRDIQFSGMPQALYGPLTFNPQDGWTIEATYYGMLAFALAIPGDNTEIYQYSSSNDYKVWGGWNAEERINTVTIINKRRNGGTVNVNIDVPSGYYVKRISLEAPGGLDAASGWTLAGLYFDVDTAKFQGEYTDEDFEVDSGSVTVSVQEESLSIVFISAEPMGNVMLPALEETVSANENGDLAGEFEGEVFTPTTGLPDPGSKFLGSATRTESICLLALFAGLFFL
ncbi:MAG: hypothetical protein SGCHY_003072 [Lobulomycetales sp.]